MKKLKYKLDKGAIDRISDVLEDSYNRITNSFNKYLEDKLLIEVYSDLNQLHIALGFPNTPNWIRGGLGSGKIVIASPLNPPPGSNFDNVVNTAVHEFLHIVINKINNNTPRGVDELYKSQLLINLSIVDIGCSYVHRWHEKSYLFLHNLDK